MQRDCQYRNERRSVLSTVRRLAKKISQHIRLNNVQLLQHIHYCFLVVYLVDLTKLVNNIYKFTEFLTGVVV